MSYHTLSPTPPSIDEQKMYTISQVRKLLGTPRRPISRATLWRYQCCGLIKPTVYVGRIGQRRFPRFQGDVIAQCWSRCMNIRLY